MKKMKKTFANSTTIHWAFAAIVAISITSFYSCNNSGANEKHEAETGKIMPVRDSAAGEVSKTKASEKTGLSDSISTNNEKKRENEEAKEKAEKEKDRE
jgi:hypothetical protein